MILKLRKFKIILIYLNEYFILNKYNKLKLRI